jgi:hypothetical protein
MANIKEQNANVTLKTKKYDGLYLEIISSHLTASDTEIVSDTTQKQGRLAHLETLHQSKCATNTQGNYGAVLR